MEIDFRYSLLVLLVFAYLNRTGFMLFVNKIWSKEFVQTWQDGARSAFNIFLSFIVLDIAIRFITGKFVVIEWMNALPLYYNIVCDMLVILAFLLGLVRKKTQYAFSILFLYFLLSHIYVIVMYYFGSEINVFFRLI